MGQLGLALALKQGTIKLSEIRSGAQAKVKRLADSLTPEQVKDYAGTPAASTGRGSAAGVHTRAVRE